MAASAEEQSESQQQHASCRGRIALKLDQDESAGDGSERRQQDDPGRKYSGFVGAEASERFRDIAKTPNADGAWHSGASKGASGPTPSVFRPNARRIPDCEWQSRLNGRNIRVQVDVYSIP